nr:MAG TPA: hypothetical protein [Caudoviricetes sp.]
MLFTHKTSFNVSWKISKLLSSIKIGCFSFYFVKIIEFLVSSGI